jgi:hypothetical protein
MQQTIVPVNWDVVHLLPTWDVLLYSITIFFRMEHTLCKCIVKQRASTRSKWVHTLGELRRALSPSYSVCILERRLERRSTSAEISIISARGRYASSPSPATKWTACSASPEVFILHPLEEMVQHFVFRSQLIPTPAKMKEVYIQFLPKRTKIWKKTCLEENL